jgi:hypothetical protein
MFLEPGEATCLSGDLPPQLRSLSVTGDMRINLVVPIPMTDRSLKSARPEGISHLCVTAPEQDASASRRRSHPWAAWQRPRDLGEPRAEREGDKSVCEDQPSP